MKSVPANTITNQQRKLLFAIIKDLRSVKRDLIIPINGILTPLPLYTLDTETARNLLKLVDLDYPRDKRGHPASQAAGEISTKDMTEHIKRLEVWAIESQIPLRHYEAEMERLSNFSQIETKFDAD